jgi:prevent-host-death family protein
MKIWQLQEAKAQLSELVETAQKTPQCISKRGKQTVIVLSMKDYQKLTKKKPTLGKFLQQSPLSEVEIEFDRDPSSFRLVKF